MAFKQGFQSELKMAMIPRWLNPTTKYDMMGCCDHLFGGPFNIVQI